MRVTSIKTKIILWFSTIFILSFTVVGLLVYQSMFIIVQNLASNYIEEMIKQVNQKIDQIIETVENNSSTALGNMQMQVLLNKAQNHEFPTFEERQLIYQLIYNASEQNPFVDAAYVYLPNSGYYGFNNSPFQMSEIKDYIIGKSKIVKGLKDHMVWMEPNQDKNGISYVFGVYKIPNFLNSTLLGYYMTVVNLDRIQKSFEEMKMGEGAKIYLINEKAQPFIGNYKDYIYPKEIFSNLIRRNNGESTGHLVDRVEGVESLITFSKSQKTNWTTVVIIPISSLIKGVVYVKYVLILFGILSMGLSFVIAKILSKRITKPIRNMQKAMKKVEKGNLDVVIPLTNTYEMNEFSNSFNHMIRKIKMLINQVYEEEIRRREAELKALQAQINPHFLYNTLDSFYWLLVIQNQDKVAELVIHLSNLFRYSIGNRDETVTLKKELEHIDHYLQIQKVRFENLEVEYDLDEKVENIHVPKLLFQPLVENAIFHGLEKKMGDRKLQIQTSTNQGSAWITIIDNGVGFEPEKLKQIRLHMQQINNSSIWEPRIGLGMENVHYRIKRFYGDDYGVEIESVYGEGAKVSIQIPLKT